MGYNFKEMKFELHSKFNPTGDQPEAIKSLTDGVLDGPWKEYSFRAGNSRNN